MYGIVIVLVGLGVGLLSGLLGVGGGSILMPIFTLGLHMPATAATGTSLFTIIPTSLAGSITHFRERTADAKVGLSMGLGGACASPLGVWLAQQSPAWLVLCAAAAVILYSSLTMLRKALMRPKPSTGKEPGELDQHEMGHQGPNTPTLVSPDLKPLPERPQFTFAIFAMSVLIGLAAGLAGGYVGLGGGFLMVPLMSALLHFPMRLASGTSLIGIICLSIPGAIMQASYGNVDLLTGVLIACGSIPGAIVGARLTKRFNDRTLRLMFAVLLGVAAVLMAVRSFA